ncbi:MAG: GNAT family N-acetyltransferase [Rhodobiaceae bacterium]|nr:GNAT family N-acetyltransferase [Rhodobiaceae bacterium]
MSLGYDELVPGKSAEMRDGRLPPRERASILLSVHTEFSTVEAIWRQFEKTADCFAFQSFDFLETWYENIGCRDDLEIQIVVAWDVNAKPLMILPLGIERSRFVRKLTWLGNDVNDYNAPLLAPGFSDRVAPGEFTRVWHDIVVALPEHDLVELMRQPAVIESQPNPFLELSTELNASGAHMTMLGVDFDVYYKEKRNAKARSHLRNRRKKLEALGETVFVQPETEGDLRQSIEKLVELKTVSLNAMGAKNFLVQPGYEEFYKSLAEKLRGAGGVYVSHLEVGGKYVAGIWGLVHKQRFYYLLASYDGPGFGRYKPGVQTLVETMRWATEQGIRTFDFTVGDESYKSKWCEVQIDLHDHLTAKTLRGSVALIRTRVFLALKRKIKQTPFLWDSFIRLRMRFLAK